MDTIDPTRFTFAFLFVLGLIGLMAACLRYWGKNKHSLGASFIKSSSDSGRISLVETRYLDARRRLVLIRCDGREHLLLLADGREQLIESFPVAMESTKAAS